MCQIKKSHRILLTSIAISVLTSVGLMYWFFENVMEPKAPELHVFFDKFFILFSAVLWAMFMTIVYYAKNDVVDNKKKK